MIQGYFTAHFVQVWIWESRTKHKETEVSMI